MNTYQTILLILASNAVPAVLGAAVTYLWLKSRGRIIKEK